MNYKHHFVAVAVALAPAACLHGTGRLVSSGVQGGIEGGLEGLNNPRNKELLVRLLRDADIQQAAHDLTAALTGGALDGLSDAERQGRVREASDAYIRAIAGSVGAALDEDLAPAVARSVDRLVGGAVASALRPANTRLAQQLVDGVTRSTVLAFTQSSAQGLREDLGPALQKVLAEDLGPALQKIVEDNLGPALQKVLERNLQPTMEAAFGGAEGGASGAMARALTKQIVLGVNDGMSELGISPSPNKKDGTGIAGWLQIIFITALVILSALLARMFFTRRALAADRARSEEMLVNILRAIDSNEPGAPQAAPSLAAVIARVQQHMPGLDGTNSYLATIVGRAQLPPRVRSPKPATSG